MTGNEAPGIAASLPPLDRFDCRGDTVVAELRLDSDLVFFRGHFPGWPILPGVALVHWVGLLGAHAFCLPPSSGTITRVKFMKALAPGDLITLRLVRRGRTRIDFSCSRDGETCVQGAMAYGEGER